MNEIHLEPDLTALAAVILRAIREDITNGWMPKDEETVNNK